MWGGEVGRVQRPEFRLTDVRRFLDGVFARHVHAKRIESLANGTLGVMTGAALAVAMIGHALAQARGLLTKHAVKQVDRLLSNAGVSPWELFARWVPEAVGDRKEIVVAMDWTDFDADGQATLAFNLVTRHGRATPLMWLTMLKDELAGRRNDIEDACLARLADLLPAATKTTILADRGFGDRKLFDYVTKLGFAYVIRFRGDIRVGAADGENRPAAAWVGKGGRARHLRGAPPPRNRSARWSASTPRT
jgi:Transposase DDE domain